MREVPKLMDQVEKSIASKRLFNRGASILLAVSGGLDSIVLLHVLERLAGSHAWRLTVAHFNHQLRGRSSDADERLVKRTAEQMGLPFVAGRADVRKFASERKLSLEMAARKLRHGFLARVAAKRRVGKIALAHHADDQVELFIIRLFRGTGSEGLAGMKWQGPSPTDASITLVRPLLDQPKSALAAYAKEARLKFREDATNRQLDIQRNRIRRELLPLLEKKYQPAISRVVLRQMEIVGAEAEFVTGAALAWLEEKKRRPAFETLPLALQRRCLQLQLTQLGVAPNFDLIEQLREFANRPVTVNSELAIYRDAGGHLTVPESGTQGFEGEAIRIELRGRAGEIRFNNTKISWARQVILNGTFRAPKPRANQESFDAAKVGADLMLRHWRAGDRFHPIGMNREVKLQDLFTNEKIPRAQRHQLLVGTTAGGKLFWVEGLRIGEAFKLDKKTRYELKWRWKRL